MSDVISFRGKVKVTRWCNARPLNGKYETLHGRAIASISCRNFDICRHVPLKLLYIEAKIGIRSCEVVYLKDDVKVVLIGAGSLTFTPSLLKGLALSDMARDASLTISLVDINPEILEVMYKVGVKLIEALRRRGEAGELKIEKHVERKEALEGADFVIITIGVGGVKATHVDVEVPRRYGIEQTVGDTVGPGGIMRALRHVPVLLDIARDMEDLCPEAYMFNYSNPLTPLTRVVQRETKIKAYGLCTGVFGVKWYLAKYFNVRPDDVEIYVGGINHLYWIIDFSVKGEPGYQLIEEKLAKEGVPDRGEIAITLKLYRIFGLIPAPGGRHVAEFFPHLFMHEEAMKKYDIPRFPEGTIYDYKLREPFEKLLKGIASGERSVDELLKVKGLEEEGIGVVRLMEAIALDKRILFPGINVPNKGVIANLPSWGVVEVPAYVDATGVHPLNMGPLPKAIAGILTQRLAQYEITIDAALSGDRSLALQALLMDGYVRSIDIAERLLDDMLRAEQEWLPSCWFK